ncbi:hypothetical protein LTS10_004482 [Elasticomyces elasticus]|nr:hypothetical protein LTS10_004482 [Elasticomyces elasticus]
MDWIQRSISAWSPNEEATIQQQGEDLTRKLPLAEPNKPTESMPAQLPGLSLLTPGSGMPGRSNLSYVLNDEPQESPCPYAGCGVVTKDLGSHIDTHLLACEDERPEKCPLPSCEYHTIGFVREADRIRHTLTHYKGELVCGFCPDGGASTERTFKRADVFKQHLMAEHIAWQAQPGSKRRSPNVYGPMSARPCSTCGVGPFPNPQSFYEHLDDCVLRYVSNYPAADLAATAQSGLNKQLWRTESQAYQDALFNLTTEFGPTPTVSSKLADPLHVSAHRNLLTERLQAADLARSGMTPSKHPGQLRFQDGSPLRPLEWVQQGRSESYLEPVGTVWPGDALLEVDGKEYGDEQSFLSQHDATSAEYGVTSPSLPVTHCTPVDSNAMAMENRQGGYNDGNSMSMQYGLFPSQFDSESHTPILDADDSQCLDHFFDHPDLMQPPRAQAQTGHAPDGTVRWIRENHADIQSAETTATTLEDRNANSRWRHAIRKVISKLPVVKARGYPPRNNDVRSSVPFHLTPEQQCYEASAEWRFADTVLLVIGKLRLAKASQNPQVMDFLYSSSLDDVSPHMATPGYAETAVLLLSSGAAQDDIIATREIKCLRAVFENLYGYRVFEAFKPSGLRTKHHIMQTLADFVQTHDLENGLLVVYYSGYGHLEENLSVTRKAPDPAVTSMQERRESITWSNDQQPLENADADVLVLLDCDHADVGDMTSNTISRAGFSNYEIVGACDKDRRVHAPGSGTFSSALTWALEVLASERSPFDVSRLQDMIKNYERFPTQQTLVRWTRRRRGTMRSKRNDHIVIVPREENLGLQHGLPTDDMEGSTL